MGAAAAGRRRPRPAALRVQGHRLAASGEGIPLLGVRHHPDDTPYEAGLGFCVRLDKDFLGRAALVDETGKPKAARRQLVCLTLEDPRLQVLGNEPIRVGAAVAGRVTSGAVGYHIGRSIAFGYLPADGPGAAKPGDHTQVLIFGQWVDAVVAAEPLFDPEGQRIRS